MERSFDHQARIVANTPFVQTYDAEPETCQECVALDVAVFDLLHGMPVDAIAFENQRPLWQVKVNGAPIESCLLDVRFAHLVKDLADQSFKVTRSRLAQLHKRARATSRACGEFVHSARLDHPCLPADLTRHLDTAKERMIGANLLANRVGANPRAIAPGACLMRGEVDHRAAPRATKRDALNVCPVALPSVAVMQSAQTAGIRAIQVGTAWEFGNKHLGALRADACVGHSETLLRRVRSGKVGRQPETVSSADHDSALAPLNSTHIIPNGSATSVPIVAAGKV